MTENKPILCVDFDGVIHSYSSGWKGANVIPDTPVAGAFKFLADATNYFRVAIYSSRSSQPGGIDAMKDWLCVNTELGFKEKPGWIDEIEFPAEKPAAFLTIDDRAICFDGDWSALKPHELLRFKPWNKRTPETTVGATGDFPDGKLNKHDQGGLRMAVGRENGCVRIDFGKPVAWFALPPNEAKALAALLMRHAEGLGR